MVIQIVRCRAKACQAKIVHTITPDGRGIPVDADQIDIDEIDFMTGPHGRLIPIYNPELHAPHWSRSCKHPGGPDA